MWSIGVVTYLLLTGHSPFNLALTISDPVEREEEVMRLAAFGQLNTSTKAWSSDLSHLAREFILACAQADPAKRFSPADALNHGFLSSSSTATQFVGFRPAALFLAFLMPEPWKGFAHLRQWMTCRQGAAGAGCTGYARSGLQPSHANVTVNCWPASVRKFCVSSWAGHWWALNLFHKQFRTQSLKRNEGWTWRR
ncbi:unnamed protein product [Effrenium voratum]|uniref:Protein kinase domain-containing protein n=1 Tax=Effrenium voratum TaxID=2562239 RepID=A0AA36JMP0_9DINO|nr:unnamed protein product [Effrenium voratum]CAJ1419036.1 unnamed protein product [Effrenium voratum]CAJ1454045.1 unnamed protein product [Effrenium voratum]